MLKHTPYTPLRKSCRNRRGYRIDATNKCHLRKWNRRSDPQPHERSTRRSRIYHRILYKPVADEYEPLHRNQRLRRRSRPLCRRKQLPLAVFDTGDNKFDPYLLQINDLHPHGDIVVLGNDKGSEFYAFATLEQILEQTDGNSIRQITFEDYSHTQYRGIVEGFYGHPYSVENRISLLSFVNDSK